MISTEQLSLLFQSAVKAGSEKIIMESAVLGSRLRLSQAYVTYGRTNVDRWIKEKLVGTQCGASGGRFVTILRNELEAVAANSNRISYLPVAER